MQSCGLQHYPHFDVFAWPSSKFKPRTEKQIPIYECLSIDEPLNSALPRMRVCTYVRSRGAMYFPFSCEIICLGYYAGAHGLGETKCVVNGCRE